MGLCIRGLLDRGLVFSTSVNGYGRSLHYTCFFSKNKVSLQTCSKLSFPTYYVANYKIIIMHYLNRLKLHMNGLFYCHIAWIKIDLNIFGAKIFSF